MNEESLKGIMSSARQDWGTPPSFLDWLAREFGWMPTLDAAASDHNAKAECFFTIEEDGLNQPWSGDVWLNPPFGSELPYWLSKCRQEFEHPMKITGERLDSIWCLIPARTDTKWFHEIVVPTATRIYLIKGRFNFRFDAAIAGANAPFPSMLVIWDCGNMRHYPKIQTLDVPSRARGFGPLPPDLGVI